MEYIWAVDAPTSAAEVHAAVAPELAYTSITTVLTRLVEKRRLTRERSGRSYLYAAARSEADYRADSMASALKLAEDRRAVLSRFVDSLGTEDVDMLRRLLDEENA